MENKQKKKSVFEKFIIWLLATLQKSFIGKFFTSYDKASERFDKKTNGGRYVSGTKFASVMEKNKVINCIPKIFQFLLRVPLRDYGIMMFLTGVLVAGLYPINGMILFVNITFEMFVFGCGVSICAIPLFFSSRSFASNVLSSKIFSFILFDFLGMDEEGFRIAQDKGRVSFGAYAFLIGTILGVLSYFLLPIYTVALVIGLFLVYCTARTPEIGVVVTMLLIPFVSISFICICIAYTFICYIVKVLLGKRILKFQYFDLWVSITIFVVVISGIDYKDPVSTLFGTTINLIIMLSYFLFSNLIYSKIWFRRSMVAFTTSSFVVAMIAIGQWIIGTLAQNLDFLEKVYSKNESIVSTLGSSNVLAHFMVIAIPFAFVHMMSGRHDFGKFVGFLLAAILTFALVISGTSFGVIGLILGVLLTLVFFNPKAIYLLVLVLIVLPTLYFTLPSDVLHTVLSTLHLQDGIIETELIYFRDSFLAVIKRPFGIGINEYRMKFAFGEEYIDSLPLNVMATHGILGAVFLIVLWVMFTRVILTYAVKAKNEYRRVNGCAGFCSMFALALVGIFNNIWVDKRIFLLFVVIMALSFAYIKIDKEEEVVSLSYVDITTATLDIPVKENRVANAIPQRRHMSISKISKQMIKKKSKKTEVKEFSNTEELIIKSKICKGETSDEENEQK